MTRLQVIATALVCLAGAALLLPTRAQPPKEAEQKAARSALEKLQQHEVKRNEREEVGPNAG